MAVKGTYTRILVDEYDFSGNNNSVEVAIASAAIDVTAFQDTGNVFLTDVPSGTITQAGYFGGGAADGFEAEMNARLGATGVTVGVLFDTQVAACPAYILPGTGGREMTISSPVSGVITLSGAWGSGTGIKRGKRILAATLTATGVQTAVDFGAAGAAGGYAYLFVQSISGTATSATIDVESSATAGGVYASEGTFTFSAVGAYAVVMSGAVDRWIRLNVTSMGGATNFVVVGVAAVSGVTM